MYNHDFTFDRVICGFIPFGYITIVYKYSIKNKGRESK